MLWTYVKPATQLVVYYVAMGRFLRLNDRVDNYVVYLFSGIVVINLFNEILRNTTASIVGNAPLVGKVYLPRELFPVASVWVAFVHFLPQVAVLLVGALVFGWRPGPMNILAFVAGVLVVAVFSLGIGLMFAAWNVLFRDAENFADLIGMVSIWLSPIFYKWDMVAGAVPAWIWAIYACNPLSVAAELFHYAFWAPTRGVVADVPTQFGIWAAVASAVCIIVLVLGQMVFRHHEVRFAEEL
jgi:ABC-2 type transport system permease protein